MSNDGPRLVGAAAPTEEERGLAAPRLEAAAEPPETFEAIYDDAVGAIVYGRSELLDKLDRAAAGLPKGPDTLPPERQFILYGRADLKRLLHLGGYASTFHDSTPCLFRLLWIVSDAVTPYTHLTFPRLFMDLADMALRIAATIEARTKGPYRRFSRPQDNPPLDPTILRVPPMDRVPDWRRFADLRTGRSRSAVDRPAPEQAFSVEDQLDWARRMDELAEEIENARIRAETRGSRTPVVSRAISTLRGLTFADAERNTRARFSAEWQAKPIGATVAVMFYNSVYSAILTPRGEPMRIPGIAPHGLLIPGPGENLLRRLQPPGLYVSLGRLAGYQLRVNGPKRVQALVYGGIFGLQRDVLGFTRQELGTEGAKSPLQDKLHEYLQANHGQYTLVSIVTPDAFGSGELSFSRLKRAVYSMIPLIAEFALKDILRRLKALPDNIGDIAADIAEEVVRGIVVDAIRDWAIEWLIKKIGKRVIPVVNVISAVADAVSGGDTELFRNVGACLIMVTRSGKPDDLTISSKILSKIAADEIADRVVDKIVSEAGKQVTRRISLPRGDPGPEVPSDAPEALPPEARPPDPDAPRPKPPPEPVLSETPPEPTPRRVPPPEPSDAARQVRDRGIEPRVDDADPRSVRNRTRPPEKLPEKAKAPDEPETPAKKPSKARPPVRRPASEVPEARKRRDEAEAEGEATLKRHAAEAEADLEEEARARGETAADTDRREVHDDLTEGTGRGHPREVIGTTEADEEELSRTPKPKKGESHAKAHGLHGEGLEQEAAGVTREVRDYRKVVNPKIQRELREEIIRGRQKGDRNALQKFFDRVDLPPEGLKEVEIPAPHGEGKKRRYDRAYPAEDGTTVLVETKNYRKKNMRLTTKIEQQIENDIDTLETYDHVRVEVFLAGKVHPETLARYREIEKEFGPRFKVRFGEAPPDEE